MLTMPMVRWWPSVAGNESGMVEKQSDIGEQSDNGEKSSGGYVIYVCSIICHSLSNLFIWFGLITFLSV